jgi:hypothetical protein
LGSPDVSSDAAADLWPPISGPLPPPRHSRRARLPSYAIVGVTLWRCSVATSRTTRRPPTGEGASDAGSGKTGVPRRCCCPGTHFMVTSAHQCPHYDSTHTVSLCQQLGPGFCTLLLSPACYVAPRRRDLARPMRRSPFPGCGAGECCHDLERPSILTPHARGPPMLARVGVAGLASVCAALGLSHAAEVNPAQFKGDGQTEGAAALQAALSEAGSCSQPMTGSASTS